MEIVDGVTDGPVIEARIALHRIRHITAPESAHPHFRGVSTLAQFVLRRLEAEEHEALTVMEDFGAWWRVGDDGRAHGSSDGFWWRELGAGNDLMPYLLSQAPIMAIRRVDMLRTLVLHSDQDKARRGILLAIANVYREHKEFKPLWLQQVNQSWMFAAGVPTTGQL